MNIPPLAGITTYEDAAKPGYTVEETVNRLLRYAWINKRVMEMALYWLNPSPEWEVKEALSLHQYLAADHAAQFRRRISEMRNPPPRMDVPPDEALEAFLAELLRAEDTLERVVGLYGVLKPALLDSYREHLETSNPIADYPSCRILRHIVIEEEEAVAWGSAAIAALLTSPEEGARAAAWEAHLRAYLAAAGGITGQEMGRDMPLPPARAMEEFVPDYMPRRDPRFELQDTYRFPPHDVVFVEEAPVDEVTLALMCKRALEMDVPECMAPMITEAPSTQPWEFYEDMGRQLWDECRHAMMGAIYFTHHGIDWHSKIALHTQFSIMLNTLMTPIEAHAVLYTIEQGLMKGSFGGKRSEWERTVAADDRLASLFQDYDWADEVLHVQIGRRWGIPLANMKRAEYVQLGNSAYLRGDAEFEERFVDPERQVEWWPAFVREVLGKETILNHFEEGEPPKRAVSHLFSASG